MWKLTLGYGMVIIEDLKQERHSTLEFTPLTFYLKYHGIWKYFARNPALSISHPNNLPTDPTPDPPFQLVS
jgi:hypothetical protein